MGVGFLHFGQTWMRSATRQHQSVGVEVVVVRFVAEIAAIGPEILTVGSLLSYPLIDPIPDKPAVRPRLSLKHIPVLLEISGAVAHGMRVLDLEKRPAFSVA